jgi:hypothetical protein
LAGGCAHTAVAKRAKAGRRRIAFIETRLQFSAAAKRPWICARHMLTFKRKNDILLLDVYKKRKS